jgi:predicted GNAT superfamily acetyltransferase
MTSLDDIAMTIDRSGFDALDRPTIDTVLSLAHAAGASRVLCEVFADDGAPAAVRERAFGRLAMQIGSGRRRSDFILAA